MQTASHEFFAFRASHFDSVRNIYQRSAPCQLINSDPLTIMTLLERITSMRTLIILMALPSAHGYATSTPMTKPAFMPQIAPSKTSSPPQKYDLGLGKNEPLTNHKRAALPPQDVATAAQYWMASEPAVTFPSPLAQQNESTLTPTLQQPAVSNKPKRTSLPLHPTRKSEDVLKISDDGMMMSASRPSAKQLDLNTVWVEMLIHNQQMQLAHAS